MGRAKELALREEEQGYYSNNTHVCTRCVEDYALRDFIRKTGSTDHQCSYCSPRSRGKTSIPFDSLVERIIEGIETEWGEPNNEGVAWDDGWVGDVYDSYDLLNDELDIGFASDKLREDVQYSLSDGQWCQKNFYELEPHQALSAGWQDFTNVVKHESRYVFFRREESRDGWRGREEIPPSEFLDALGSVISSCNLYTKLAKGTIVCRLRVHNVGEKFRMARELGSPPPEAAKYPNRMSAAGISAFYAAFDKKTAVAETTTEPSKKPMAATLGKFELVRDLHLVDFTKLPPSPSIFEPDSHTRRHGIRFLHDFLRDFTAPIKKDGREHIEYVPTQVVAEYLRFVHKGRKGRSIDGILYPSARNQDAEACVLFIGPDGACDPGEDEAYKVVKLTSAKTFKLK
ncbi:HEPN-associated N-terminal domain-containing protein [Cupriavidus consociatus]|uniref:HEPN-associated N-terminal domain-containing protein n=1 Tax=Cupriavidus consociatus TaxID=2821357 RepID=UPI001AEB5FA8|nr:MULTISPECIES: HEPN-associated N-terminal domain-containing protein [unclassified Cupriavidus]MBP0624019.1 RES domain-containing protein [Cupriavidus sp. LEh25]MDK2660729.1 HEPN-associated N-terminal domain-containing protein [Cupriavidus sp. LEh21]